MAPPQQRVIEIAAGFCGLNRLPRNASSATLGCHEGLLAVSSRIGWRSRRLHGRGASQRDYRPGVHREDALPGGRADIPGRGPRRAEGSLRQADQVPEFHGQDREVMGEAQSRYRLCVHAIEEHVLSDVKRTSKHVTKQDKARRSGTENFIDSRSLNSCVLLRLTLNRAIRNAEVVSSILIRSTKKPLEKSGGCLFFIGTTNKEKSQNVKPASNLILVQPNYEPVTGFVRNEHAESCCFLHLRRMQYESIMGPQCRGLRR